MSYKILLLTGLLALIPTNSALSQIINDNSQSNDETSSVSIPGLYFSPTSETPPSFSDMDGTTESGSIQTNFLGDSNLTYNPQRVWKKGATPDALSKIGDFTSNPDLDPFFNFKQLTFKRILGNQNPNFTPLKSVGIINSLTLGEFLEIFPNWLNLPVSDVLIINESLKNTNISLSGDRILSNAQRILLEQLANNPAYENIPIESIIVGDWGDLISPSEQLVITSASTVSISRAKYPYRRSIIFYY